MNDTDRHETTPTAPPIALQLCPRCDQPIALIDGWDDDRAAVCAVAPGLSGDHGAHTGHVIV